jgi:lipoyl synthase
MAKQQIVQGQKLRGEDKMKRIPIKVEPTTEMPRKPDWIRVKLPTGNEIAKVKEMLRDNKLHTVCEEASCPNLPECFSHGTATFMIMGDICTRRCSFCDVAHGRPNALDADEPKNVGEAVAKMKLKYVVVTSVDRDDLRDGGAQHFADVTNEIRQRSPGTKIEVLVPDFRGRMDIALENMANGLPDVFNHNLETAPSLYKQVRPGSDYQWSLDLLQKFKQKFPDIATKSGIMVGLGETDEEVEQVMFDMRKHDIDMITIGQYLQPSKFHSKVERFVTPEQFKKYEEIGYKIGFKNVASGPMVRSSYHADKQAAGEKIS